MPDDYADARTFANIKLRRLIGDPPRALQVSEIRDVVNETLDHLGFDAIDVDRLVAELEQSFATVIGTERVLTSDEDGYEPWLPGRKAAISWAYWVRYEQYLLEQGWARQTLLRLDETTDKVLGLLTAPDRSGEWDRRGMVVGHVQSGKTSHYIGLICKAADAGYKLVIVLAGFHKSLRSQTQVRLEEGFLGYDISRDMPVDGALRPVGVGSIDASLRPDTVTTRADGGDFKRQVANQLGIAPGGRPLLLVVKKNGPVLRNLLNWLKSVADATDREGRPYLKDIPMLVVDDEADQGSIDTKDGVIDEFGNIDSEHDPTTLNKRIRELLHMFEKSAYVGYTATPFANIFIHESGRTGEQGEDLFPRSFIVSLPTPSNYVGPSRVFGQEDANGEFLPGLSISRSVTDHADSLGLRERSGWVPPLHNKDHLPLFEGTASLPHSLRKAIRCFILSTSARYARGQENSHNSMLVHVTRFTNVQGHVVEQIREEVADIRRQLRYSTHSIHEELHDLWNEDYVPTTNEIHAIDCPPVSWGNVKKWLDHVIQSIDIRAINGLAGEVLDYIANQDLGLNVIAVGGDKLSRGLTLEGLTVSYFLRASRMYDTLMQMGRWFGYRPGYLDLCRLFSTPDLIDWFSHIANASEELREDFDRMVASGGTPRDFGHRVRCHPLLLVTSRVKMRHGQEIQVTFAGSISETTSFRRDLRSISKNWDAAVKLIQRIEASTAPPSGEVKQAWQNVDPELVLEFLGSYQEHDASTRCIPKLLTEYIRAEVESGRLTSWAVRLCPGELRQFTIGDSSIKLADRAYYAGRGLDEIEADKARAYLRQDGHYRIRRLISPADETAALTREQVKAALAKTIRDFEEGNTRHKERPTAPSGANLRALRPVEQGLLLIYLIDGNQGENRIEKAAQHLPVVGFAISFPQVDDSDASRVKYRVNNVYYEQEFGQKRLDEEVID